MDADVDSAARRLLDATGGEGHFGYASRNASTGELEVVYAVRGPDAKRFLDLLSSQPPDRWRQLLRSLAPRPGEPD